MVVHLRKISNTKRVMQQSPLGKTNGLCTIRQGDEWSTQNTWRGASSWFICCCACGIYATIFQRKGRRPYVSLSGFATVCWEIPDVEAQQQMARAVTYWPSVWFLILPNRRESMVIQLWGENSMWQMFMRLRRRCHHI